MFRLVTSSKGRVLFGGGVCSLPVSRIGVIYNKNKTVQTLMLMAGALESQDTGSVHCV